MKSAASTWVPPGLVRHECADSIIKTRTAYEDGIASAELKTHNGESYGLTLYKKTGAYEVHYMPKLTQAEYDEADRLQKELEESA